MTFKKKVAASATVMTLMLTGCSSKSEQAATTGNQLTGVAATGAPVVNGKVEVKGANGTVVETTTTSTGSYGASVSTLTSPFLIRVTTPTGEKLISVASSADVAANKTVNVTPITHTIVANVFQQKSADTLFENFTTKATEFTATKLDDAKDDFKQNLIAAGVIGASGVLTDSNIDLMNGNFTAGSGAGVDKLLDALDIDIDKGATNIEIKLKDGTAIYSDDVATNTEVVSDQSAGITAVKTQLTALEEIKTFFTNASATFNSFTTSCGGAAVDDGSACDKDTLHDTMAEILHTDYKWSGANKTTDAWSMFCQQDADGNSEASMKSDCNFVRADRISFSDITILKYKELSGSDAEAVVQTNSYWNGVYADTEIEFVKKEGGAWKLYGNQNSKEFWFEGTALHKTTYPNSGAATDKYAAEIQLYIGGNQAAIGTSITLKAMNKDGTTPNTALNTALVGSGDGTTGLVLGSDSTFSLFVPGKRYITYATNTATGTNCGDGTCGTNYDANKLELNDAALAAMDSVQAFVLTYTDLSSVVKTEHITIRRPMKITATSAVGLVPQFTTSNLCTAMPASNTYNFSIPTGQSGDWASIYVGGQGTSAWANATGNATARGVTSLAVDNTGGIITPDHAHFYLKSIDEFGRKFLRIIECQ